MLSEQQVADLLGDIDETAMHGVEWRAYFQAGGRAKNFLPMPWCPIAFITKTFRLFHTDVIFFKVRTHQAKNSLHKLLPPPSSSSGYTFRKSPTLFLQSTDPRRWKVSCYELSVYGMRYQLSLNQWNQFIALKLLWETISNSSDPSNSCHFFSPSFLHFTLVVVLSYPEHNYCPFLVHTTTLPLNRNVAW